MTNCEKGREGERERETEGEREMEARVRGTRLQKSGRMDGRMDSGMKVWCSSQGGTGMVRAGSREWRPLSMSTRSKSVSSSRTELRRVRTCIERRSCKHRLVNLKMYAKDDSDNKDVTGKEEFSDVFVRTPVQEKIKQADDFVKNTQNTIGRSINNVMRNSGIGKAIGVKSEEDDKTEAEQSSKKWPAMREELLRCGVRSISKEEVCADGDIVSFSKQPVIL